MTVTDSPIDAAAQRDALGERIFEQLLVSTELLTVDLGLRTGLYHALSELGTANPAELAGAAGVHPRYAREWLEQQAVAGYVQVATHSDDDAERRYLLPPGHAEALLDPDSPGYVGAASPNLVGLAGVIREVSAAYRAGTGVPYSDYGEDIRHGIGGFNRPMFVNDLAATWMAAVPDLHAKLVAAPAPRILDVGSGTGWSTIALARAYPRATVVGLDMDEASVTEARQAAHQAGVSDRVEFVRADAADTGLDGTFDLITIFEALHDMAHPVVVLEHLRSLLADGASIIVGDERVAESFAAPGDEIERFMYMWSVLHCLPATMAEGPSVDAGTVLRADTVRSYGALAGFGAVEELAIENDFWRFYRISSDRSADRRPGRRNCSGGRT